MSEEFCSQCYGKGWVRIEGNQVECIACLMRRKPAPDPEDHHSSHGNGTLSHVKAANGTTASVSQEANGWPAAFAKAVLP